MNMRALMIVVAGLLIAADAKEDAVKKEKEKLQGTWKAVAEEKSGKQVPEKSFKALRFVFKGDKLRIIEGKEDIEATYTIDPSQKLKTIDVIIKIGDETITAKGVYELKEDSLKICMRDNPDGTRPTELGTKDGNKTVMTTFKREKQ